MRRLGPRRTLVSMTTLPISLLGILGSNPRPSPPEFHELLWGRVSLLIQCRQSPAHAKNPLDTLTRHEPASTRVRALQRPSFGPPLHCTDAYPKTLSSVARGQQPIVAPG